MKSSSYIYFEKQKEKQREQSETMTTLHRLFGFGCNIPDAPVTRSNRILDKCISVGIGPELKKTKKKIVEKNETLTNFGEAIFDAIQKAERPLTSAEIANRLGIGRSTAKTYLFKFYQEKTIKRTKSTCNKFNVLTYYYSKI